MLNKIMLIGRLGKDPEVRTYENGVHLVRLSLATNESYKDQSGNWQDSTLWHDLVFWREAAERAERTLRKGALVYVEGKLQYREWTEEDGKRRRTSEIHVQSFRLLSPKGEGEQQTTHEAEKKDSKPLVMAPVKDDMPF